MRGSPGAACFDLAHLAAATRSGELGGVVGIDLAGDEYHFNNSRGHVEACFRYAKRELQLNTTVHAGEMAGPQDVRSAVEVMLSDRVGHGYSAIDDVGVLTMLMQRDVHLEACPAGHHNNLNATGVYQQYGLNFGLSTDDPAAYFANTSMGAVEALVRSRLGFSSADIARAHRHAYAAAFAPSAAAIVAQQRSAADSASAGDAGAVAAGDADSSGVGQLGLVLAASAVVVLAALWWAVTLWWGLDLWSRRRARGRAWRGRATKAMAALDMAHDVAEMDGGMDDMDGGEDSSRLET